MNASSLEMNAPAQELSADQVDAVSGGLRRLSPEEETTYAVVVSSVSAGSVAAGVALGAAIGAAGGPVGAGIGALVGAIFGAVVYLAQP